MSISSAFLLVYHSQPLRNPDLQKNFQRSSKFRHSCSWLVQHRQWHAQSYLLPCQFCFIHKPLDLFHRKHFKQLWTLQRMEWEKVDCEWVKTHGALPEMPHLWSSDLSGRPDHSNNWLQNQRELEMQQWTYWTVGIMSKHTWNAGKQPTSSSCHTLHWCNVYRHRWLGWALELAATQKTTYYNIQASYLIPVIEAAYKKQENIIKAQLICQTQDGQGVQLCGDGRSDSPGHSCKYTTYSFMDDSSNQIVVFDLVQVNKWSQH